MSDINYKELFEHYYQKAAFTEMPVDPVLAALPGIPVVPVL